MHAAKSGRNTGLFLTLAVATSLAVGSVGYMSGSAPEWIVLKASVGLLCVGALGWLLSALMNALPEAPAALPETPATPVDEEPGQEREATLAEAMESIRQADASKGSLVDLTLEETEPDDPAEDAAVTLQSSER